MNFLKTVLLSVLFAFAGVAAAATPINLNSASVEQLVELNGIGPAKAQAIVAYRQEHGPFKSIEQLANVKGIGLKLVEKNREAMSVGVVKATPASPAVAKAAPVSKL
ncbi:MAG: competence protein ComEA [Lysobacterales bacterium CG02_land_8_20_14_3_00_62_12]|nr:MAG: competence protein ComEA [Xanthomonadales bacterium CG02_land_8_20_14_3_00_62_12]PJA41273.1 MAG: competence protein ComEA [Xanthomonadales bacterium CG_4_9_14_3_um_filter_62_6]